MDYIKTFLLPADSSTATHWNAQDNRAAYNTCLFGFPASITCSQSSIKNCYDALKNLQQLKTSVQGLCECPKIKCFTKFHSAFVLIKSLCESNQVKYCSYPCVHRPSVFLLLCHDACVHQCGTLYLWDISAIIHVQTVPSRALHHWLIDWLIDWVRLSPPQFKEEPVSAIFFINSGWLVLPVRYSTHTFYTSKTQHCQASLETSHDSELYYRNLAVILAPSIISAPRFFASK